MTHLVQEMKIATGIAPTIGGAVPIDGNGINLDSGHTLYIVCHMSDSGGDAMTFVPQRDDAAGTAYIPLVNNALIWMNADTGADDVLVRQTDDVDQAVANTATGKMVVFQINPDSLGDHTGGTNDPCTRVRIRVDVAEATHDVSVVYYLVPRYQQATIPEIRV